MAHFRDLPNCIMGIELNNNGSKAQKILQRDYGIKLQGIATCGIDVKSTLSKMNKYATISETVKRFKEGKLLLPEVQSPEIKELVSQLHYMHRFMGADGSVKIKAKKGHDDLVMALVLCIHVIMMYEQEADYNN